MVGNLFGKMIAQSHNARSKVLSVPNKAPKCPRHINFPFAHCTHEVSCTINLTNKRKMAVCSLVHPTFHFPPPTYRVRKTNVCGLKNPASEAPGFHTGI